MQKLKVAIIGAGSVAHFHAWAIEQLPDQATLVGVQSSNFAAAGSFASQYGAKACSTLDELLDLCLLYTSPSPRDS